MWRFHADSGCGCGGVEYVGVFDSANNGYNQPALVFTKGVGTGAKNIAEAASHESGHNLGLSHDGTSTSGYYSGQGAWAPIMGASYSKAITQWSKGQYANVSGVNASVNDVDYFKISLAAGTYAFTANPAATGANLDIKLTLFNGAGTALGSYDPASGQASASTAYGLGAGTRWSLNGGTYYIRVDDTGYGDPLTTGYSAYGRTGAFTLQVVAS